MTYVLIILAGLSGDTRAATAVFSDRAQCEIAARWVTAHRANADAVCLPGGVVVGERR